VFPRAAASPAAAALCAVAWWCSAGVLAVQETAGADQAVTHKLNDYEARVVKHLKTLDADQIRRIASHMADHDGAEQLTSICSAFTTQRELGEAKKSEKLQPEISLSGAIGNSKGLINGQYSKTDEKINGSPAYKRSDGKMWLVKSTNGDWYVQDTHSKGLPGGWAYTSDANPVSKSSWRVWTGNAWQTEMLEAKGGATPKKKSKAQTKKAEVKQADAHAKDEVAALFKQNKISLPKALQTDAQNEGGKKQNASKKSVAAKRDSVNALAKTVKTAMKNAKAAAKSKKAPAKQQNTNAKKRTAQGDTQQEAEAKLESADKVAVVITHTPNSKANHKKEEKKSERTAVRTKPAKHEHKQVQKTKSETPELKLSKLQQAALTDATLTASQRAEVESVFTAVNPVEGTAQKAMAKEMAKKPKSSKPKITLSAADKAKVKAMVQRELQQSEFMYNSLEDHVTKGSSEVDSSTLDSV